MIWGFSFFFDDDENLWNKNAFFASCGNYVRKIPSINLAINLILNDSHVAKNNEEKTR